MYQKVGRSGTEDFIGFILRVNHFAECLQHRRKVCFELLNGGAKTSNFWPFKTEEKLEQLSERGGISHVAPKYFTSVLP
ncbi:hypothetical protein D3C76_1501600 [compost metagenome]